MTVKCVQLVEIVMVRCGMFTTGGDCYGEMWNVYYCVRFL